MHSNFCSYSGSIGSNTAALTVKPVMNSSGSPAPERS
jgi:hypothetical protein